MQRAHCRPDPVLPGWPTLPRLHVETRSPIQIGGAVCRGGGRGQNWATRSILHFCSREVWEIFFVKLEWEQTLAVERAIEQLLMRYQHEIDLNRLSPEVTSVLETRHALLEATGKLLEIHYGIEREVFEPDDVLGVLTDTEALKSRIERLLEEEERHSSAYLQSRSKREPRREVPTAQPELPVFKAVPPRHKVPTISNRADPHQQASDEAARLGIGRADGMQPINHALTWGLGGIAAATMIGALEPAAIWTVVPAGVIAGVAALGIAWGAKRKRGRWIDQRVLHLIAESKRDSQRTGEPVRDRGARRAGAAQRGEQKAD